MKLEREVKLDIIKTSMILFTVKERKKRAALREMLGLEPDILLIRNTGCRTCRPYMMLIMFSIIQHWM